MFGAHGDGFAGRDIPDADLPQAVTRGLASGLKLTVAAQPASASSEAIGLRAATSQSRTVLSALPDASKAPSELKLRLNT